MERKFAPVAHVKALTEDDEPGTFEAIVAVFGNVDRYGDRIEPGAFKNSLSEQGLPPIVWSHDWQTPPIGAPMAAEERSEGLYVKGRLFTEENDRAREVYAAMKATGGDGRPPLREFSFAYDIVTAGWEVEDEEEIFSLKELELIEVGPCLKGVNPDTRLIGVKGADAVTGIPIGSDGRRVKEQPGGSPEREKPELSKGQPEQFRRLALARPRHTTT